MRLSLARRWTWSAPDARSVIVVARRSGGTTFIGTPPTFPSPVQLWRRAALSAILPG